MTCPSKESLRLYRQNKAVEQELAEANDLLRPIHARVIALQDKARMAAERMNLSFHADGIEPARAFRMCQNMTSGEN